MRATLYRMCGLDIASTARLVSSARIWGRMGVHIGAETFVGHDVLIVGGAGGVWIGDNVDIGPRVNIVAGSHRIDVTGARSAGPGVSRRITIETGVWVGAGSTILSGVTIGAKSVIGAGSVVTKDIPAAMVAYGVPCRVARPLTDETWGRFT